MFGGGYVIITVLPWVALCARVEYLSHWFQYVRAQVMGHFVSGYGVPVICKIATPELCPQGTSVKFGQVIALWQRWPQLFPDTRIRQNAPFSDLHSLRVVGAGAGTGGDF